MKREHTDAWPEGATVALFVWSNVIEDFLDTLGLSLESYAREFQGSWILEYAEALRESGMTPIIFCVSREVSAPVYLTHEPSGTAICALPATRPYRVLSRFMRYPYGRSTWSMFKARRGRRWLQWPFLAVLQWIALYLPTPPLLLARELRRLRCSVLICQEYEYPRFDVCVVIGRLLRIPVYASFQGGNYHHSPLEKWVRPLTLRAAAGAFIASRTELERVHQKYGVPLAKLHRIFNPTNIDAWRPGHSGTAREELGIPAEAQVVVWHGRVSIHHKGLDILLQAWDIVCRRFPDRSLRLLLIGGGPDEKELEKRIESESLPGVVRVREFVHERQRLQRYLSAGDLYAFPSRHEGFALAPVEAMACGLPIVAADAQGISDLLEGGMESGGIVVPTEDAGALADAIILLLADDDLRSRLAQRARARAMDFSRENVGNRLREALAATHGR